MTDRRDPDPILPPEAALPLDAGPEPADDEPEALAAEYALGLLADDEARAARSRLRTDPAFAAAVAGWHERLAALAETMPAQLPPQRLKVALNRRIDGETAAARPQGITRRALGLWLGGLGASAVAAALLGGVWTGDVWTGGGPGTGRMDYQSELSLPDHGLKIMARVDSGARMVEVDLMEGAPDAGRDMQLWWIAGPGAPPVALAMVPRAGHARMPLPAGLSPGPATMIALSDEPPGGAPAGRPGKMMTMAPLLKV